MRKLFGRLFQKQPGIEVIAFKPAAKVDWRKIGREVSVESQQIEVYAYFQKLIKANVRSGTLEASGTK